jgi:hypothetical protein
MPDLFLAPGAWPAVDARDWGAVFDAFPVEAPFEVRPDLAKMTPADDWLRVDREWPAMLAAKQAAAMGTDTEPPADNIMLSLAADGHTCSRRLAAIGRAAGKLSATEAGRRLDIRCADGEGVLGAAGLRWRVDAGKVHLQADRADAVPVVTALAAGDEAARALGALAMSLQEDLVLMETGVDGAPRAVVFHVSFPSSWNPAAKLGQDLLALHGPVADNALLQSAAARLGKALVSKGPFVRWVWTITANPRWRAWPPRAPAEGPPLYFRLERQTTMPLGDGYGLFLIRVQVRPLADVLARAGRLALLQASLRSMSPEMVRYKSLGPARDVVLRM